MDNEKPKFNLPAKLVGPLLACLYLIGHMGASKMIENLKSYHNNNKYTHIKKLWVCIMGAF
jgi:hypothetical protein